MSSHCIINARRDGTRCNLNNYKDNQVTSATSTFGKAEHGGFNVGVYNMNINT